MKSLVPTAGRGGGIAQARTGHRAPPSSSSSSSNALAAPVVAVAKAAACSNFDAASCIVASPLAAPFPRARASVRARVVQQPGAPPQQQQAPPEAPPVPTDGVAALPVARGVTLLRGSTGERLKYEVEYALKRGTTENAYLLAPPGAGGEKVLIDVPFKAFADDFVECLAAQGDLGAIGTVIITHMGPNRVPTLAAVLTRIVAARPPGAPRVRLVVSNPLVKVLQSGLTGEAAALLDAVELVPVLGEAAISLPGGGPALDCICTPTPRWPDLMVVYDPSSRVAFTSKLFSAHASPKLVSAAAGAQAFDVGGWDAYGEQWRYFFECMLAPVARQAAAALEKLPLSAAPRASLERPADFLASLNDVWNAALRTMAGVDNRYADTRVAYALAPQHGPVVRASLARLVREYEAWAQAQVEALSACSVAVLYASAYGNTAALAQAISRGITKGGIAVNTVNLELSPLDEVVAAVKASDGFVIGSPTLGGHMPTQVQLALGSVLREPAVRPLPCGVFGSFGWSGEAVDEMESKLKDGGFRFAFDALRVKFKPSAKDLLACEQAGRDLAVQVKRRLKARERGAAAAPAAVAATGAQLAVGRVVGSLCVVTARDEGAAGAMLASWVSQASFDPPGLTVAVKRDRAMEPMLTAGNKFAMSLLAEGRYKPVMKALTKPFQPGEDRLAGLETTESPASGCPVIAGAAAHLDCEVVSRIEAGDHYIVYAKVEGGAVDDDAALTAVHHRKVGTHY